MGIISYLVDFFQRLPVAERPGYLLLLPTKNLIEQFQYRLTQTCGTTLLPCCYTISTFIQDYGQEYTRPISNAARRAVMHQAISSKKFIHFAGGSEATLFSLWEDFVFTGRIAAADELNSGKFLKETLSSLAPTINRSATYQQFMESYLEEFNDIFKAYLELLAGMQLEEPLLVNHRQITTTIGHLPEIARRFQLLVADLYDAPPIQLQLLEALSRLGAAFVFSGYYFDEPRRWPELIKHLPPEQITWCSPTAKEILRRAAAPDLQKFSPLPVAESVPGRVFPSVAAECRYVIHQALTLVCDGIPADEIAIVVTDQRHYREILYSLIHALPASRMPLDIFSFNLKRQIEHSALAIFIETLIRLAGGAPLSTQLLLEAIESPFFSHFFLLPVAVPAGRLGRDGNTPESDSPESEKNESAEKAIVTTLRQELTDQVITATETLKIMAKRSSDPGLQRGINALIAAGKYFPTHALLSDYLEIIAGLIEQSTGIIGDLYENTVRDHLAAVVEELRQMELNIPFQLSSFHAFFLAAISSEETGLNYDYLSGIQILDPRDAKGIAAKALFLTGNSSGSFLGQGHQNRCFSPRQQELLGLITPDRQEILQRFTVYSLINNSEQVWCTRALEIEGRTREANIFFKELLWAGMEPLIPMVEIVWTDQKTEKKPAGENQAGEVLLPIQKLPQRLSGHQATHLLQCPARYLFEALRIQAPAMREERLDPLGEGAILHQVAEILGKSLPKPKDKSEIIDKIRDISRQLEITWEERMLFSFLDHSGCWERLADFLLEDRGETLAVEEWIAADLEPVTGLPIQGVGKIDRRDRGTTGERLVDYKRSKIPSKKAINGFADVQLLFYALLKTLNGEKVDTIAYYSIRQRQRNCSKAEVEPLLATFRDILRQQLHGILDSGGYRKIIAEHCARCPYKEICLDESQLRSMAW